MCSGVSRSTFKGSRRALKLECFRADLEAVGLGLGSNGLELA